MTDKLFGEYGYYRRSGGVDDENPPFNANVVASVQAYILDLMAKIKAEDDYETKVYMKERLHSLQAALYNPRTYMLCLATVSE